MMSVQRSLVRHIRMLFTIFHINFLQKSFLKDHQNQAISKSA